MDMKKYNQQIIGSIRKLRSDGLTYSEICDEVGEIIPKGSLSYICKGVIISAEGTARMQEATVRNRIKARQAAVLSNKVRFARQLQSYRKNNVSIAYDMQSRNAQLIALAMLYLGEGAKWQKSRAPKLGSANPEIIRLYIDLLNSCYGVEASQLRCRVQHRADQNSVALVKYWSDITGVSSKRFYPSYIDKRTIGKVTQKSDYKGVCTVHCAGTHIQLELAEIADIINKSMRGISSFGRASGWQPEGEEFESPMLHQ